MNNLKVDDFKYLFGMAEDEAFEMPTIKREHRVNFGNLILEGYSQLFWKP